MHGWTHRDSLELYNLEAWGAGFFSVNDRGHVEVRPQGPPTAGSTCSSWCATSSSAACARRC